MKLKQPDIKGFNPLDKINEKSKPTPMMQQYLEVKGRHQEYLLFYRMGDFYELFFEDAVLASSVLGIALTKRGRFNNKDIPMCGVPAHSSQTYLSRLINLGHKVAIAEQLEPVKLENSFQKHNKIFKRDVVKIITPGTILDDSLLESKFNNHLMSISFIKGEISISWADMSTGVIKLQKIGDNDSIDELFELVSKIKPEEIILSDRIEKIKLLGPKFHLIEKKISKVPKEFFEPQNNKSKIKEFFANSCIESFGNLTNSDLSALGALINYIELTQKQNIPLINDFEVIKKLNFMQIDDFSARSLELFEKNDGSKTSTLLDVIDQTKTSAGSRLLKDFLKFPLISKREIIKRHKLIENFEKNSLRMEAVINLLSEQSDVERALSRISSKINNPRDMLLVRNFLSNSEKIFLEVQEIREDGIESLLVNNDSREKASKLKDLILKNIIDTPPLNLNDGAVFREGINKDLDFLRNIKNEKQQEILNMQVKYCRLTQISNLKIKFNNIHGYFVEVTNKNAEKVINFQNLKFSLIQNTVNNSRFQTDELKKASGEIQTAQEESILLEKKLYNKICEEINESSKNVYQISKTISFIDVITSFASLAITHNYCKPNLIDKSLIDINEGRHPVVEDSLLRDSKEFTPNDCKMDQKNSAWLMTGPNMAGKSTFLRQTAIIIILNQIGSFVPAKSANLGIFDKIFTRIGASDNLSRGMSTFMTEMVETSRIINESSEKSLVILDELGRGTSTEDGLAIAQAVLEYILKEVKCLTLFATHYKQLCSLANEHSVLKLKTLKIKKWNDEIIFIYKVIDGISEGSFGIHVANLAGVKKSVLERSRKVLENINSKKDYKDTIIEKSHFKVEDDDNSKKFNNLKNMLNRLNLDELSPKDALDILYAMKKNF